MSVRFAKAHGHGNDFLLVEAHLAPAEAADWARRLCDRHTGVGADGVLLYEARGSDCIAMRLLNADGSAAEISGNGLRCLAAWGVRQGLVAPEHVVETAAGPRAVRVSAIGPVRYRVEADLGRPQAAGALDEILEAGGQALRVTAISMGNPHCAVLTDTLPDDATLFSLGPAIERHPRFPGRTNVEFVSVESRGSIRVRFWERGAGHTRSSGTGSASAAAAAILHGRVDRRLLVHCEGGSLAVEWPEGGSLRQSGEVEFVAEGEWLTS
jgi:diaminopimelate epimerase